MKAILKTLSEKEKELIEQWYCRDVIAVPEIDQNIYEYVLQVRSEEFKEYKNWEPVEKPIRAILRKAVQGIQFDPDKDSDRDGMSKYLDSATHQEIKRGALNPPTDIVDIEKHVFAFSRTITGLSQDSKVAGFIDPTAGKPDEYWEDPGLLGNCPKCGEPLKFNPFIAGDYEA